MRKTAKKGFTIVELVIVIAVIAVLAAVLIPTFVSLVNKANNSADTQMIANINKYLAAVENTDGKNTTMAEAMADALDAGYGVRAIENANNSDNCILWDSKTDRFMAIDDGNIVAGVDGAEYVKDEDAETYGRYWVVSKKVSEVYATYLIGNEEDFTSKEIKLGLDLTAYEGSAPIVTIGAAGVKLNGVIHTLNAGSYNPTVYGYVYMLTGSVKSEGALFHANYTNGDYTVECMKGTVTPEAVYGCYDADGNEQCDFCNSDKQWKCSHDELETKTTPATCTSIGLTTSVCKKCGYTVVAEAIPMTAHDTEATEAKAPTCYQVGWDAYVTCKDCGYTTKKEIPATGNHTLVDSTENVEATCTTPGFTAGKHCSTEGCTYAESGVTVTPAKGHSFSNHTYDENATCVKDGTKTARCANCDATETIADPEHKATGHSFTDYVSDNNATCLLDGTKTAKCDNANCDEKHTVTDEGTKKDHSYTVYISDGNVTCASHGTKTATCDICKVATNTVEDSGSTLKAHTEKLVGKDKEVTCTEAGYKAERYCEVCNQTLSQAQEIPATGHSKEYNLASNEASASYTCTNKNCGAKREYTNIDDSILTDYELGEAVGDNGVERPVEPGDYANNADTIVFGFKDKYAATIEAAKKAGNAEQMKCENADIEIWVIFKANPRKGDIDKRTHLLDIYVLSDKVMCFNASGTGSGLLAGYGMFGIEWGDPEGALSEVRLENFDTKNATNLAKVFNECVIDKLVIGENFVINTTCKDQKIFWYKEQTLGGHYYCTCQYTIHSIVCAENWTDNCFKFEVQEDGNWPSNYGSWTVAENS